MKLDDDSYVDRLYFVGWNDGDWMGTIYRHADGPWLVEYRFRYYVDDKSWDSDDVKNFYAMTAPDGSEKSLSKLRDAMALLASMTAVHYEAETVDEVAVLGSGARMVDCLATRSWASTREVPSGPPVAEA